VGDSPVGWTVGFIQAQWVETNWCYYRGQHVDDGSIFIQRGKPPARRYQEGRDCVDGSPINSVFYSALPGHSETANAPAGGAFPLKLSVRHFDQPSDICALVERNTIKGRPNCLSEAQLEFHFCTLLTVRTPGGEFHHQRFLYWNIRWCARFHPTTHAVPPAAFGIELVPSGTDANVGHVGAGAPADPRFSRVLTAPQTGSCNQVFAAAIAAAEAVGSPNRHQSATWQKFDVRRS